MVRALFAEVRICRRTNPRGEPNPTFLVHHRVMVAGLAVPDRLLAPIGRGAHRRVLRGWRLRIAYRVFHFHCGVALRVEDWNEIRALLGGPVELAVSVDRGLAPIGRNLIVEVGRRPAPVPQGEHDIALDSLWPRGLREGKLPS